jgi:uncharacterized membrane protein
MPVFWDFAYFSFAIAAARGVAAAQSGLRHLEVKVPQQP